ncbi:MAG: hypothetical protein EBQ99_08190 [Planctomycetes bacterium]|nr:hypothetical protein [Planctomycetota bacterium]
MRAIASILALLLATHVAMAQSVEFHLPSREGWVGSPMVMQVEVSNADADAVPVVRDSPDFSCEVDPSPQRMEMRQSVNGRATTRTTLTWQVVMVPRREGTLTLPSVEVKSASRTWRSPTERVTISSASKGDLLKLELVSDPPGPWVGQSVELTLRVMVRPFTSPQHGVQLDEAQMWRLLDGASSQWGAFEPRLRELSQSNRRPVGREERVDGRTWLVYELSQAFAPARPGPLDPGTVEIAWRYPTGVSVGRDFFGAPELSLSGVRPVRASLGPCPITARAVPEAGRPASFRGAVGDFAIRATAKPSQVAVGDPITLSVAITDLSRGGNELKTLQPPVIDQASLGGGFRVPSDPLAGTVDGGTKTFTQSIRPNSVDVNQIPPIEFAFFEPTKGEYQVVRSQPIPIQVSPSERLGTPVAVAEVAGSDRPAPTTRLTEVEGGVVANVAPSAALLADQRMVPGLGSAALLAVPPMLALAALVLARRRDALASDVGLARSLAAARTARAAMDSATDAAAVSSALCDFIADRTSHGRGTVTRTQAIRLAHQAGGDAALTQALDALLARGERSAFAPDRGGQARDLRDQALALLPRLDRLDWKRRKADVLEVSP